MTRRGPIVFVVATFVTLAGSCNSTNIDFLGLIIQTRLAFVNFSKTRYVAFGIRQHETGDVVPQEFQVTPLLPPGAVYRAEFDELIGTGCPEQIDLSVYTYRRVNDTIPVGLDVGEAVEQTPEVMGQKNGVRVCPPPGEPALESFTIVNWEAAEGIARVQLAQESQLAGVLEFPGENPPPIIEPPALLSTEPIRGKVVRRADGSGASGVGVMLRSRFRVRLDNDPTNDPDAGYSEPIAFASTDNEGDFVIDRPAGGYQLEFFSDQFDLRPPAIEVETPIEIIRIIAEPIGP